MKILMKMRKLQLDGNEESRRSGMNSGKRKSIEVRDPYLLKIVEMRIKNLEGCNGSINCE